MLNFRTEKLTNTQTITNSRAKPATNQQEGPGRSREGWTGVRGSDSPRPESEGCTEGRDRKAAPALTNAFQRLHLFILSGV